MASIPLRALSALCLLAPAPVAAAAQATDADVARLVAAMLGDTPMLSDLERLVDGFGGRATGSSANAKAVEWALARFREANVDARAESFTMPGLWLERSSSVTIRGTSLPSLPGWPPFRSRERPVRVASPALCCDAGGATPPPLPGSAAERAGAWVLIEQDELADIDGLFREYALSGQIEARAWRAARRRHRVHGLPSQQSALSPQSQSWLREHDPPRVW